MPLYAVFRLFDDRPGLADYLGQIEAKDLAAAEQKAEKCFRPEPGEWLDVFEEDEEPPAA